MTTIKNVVVLGASGNVGKSAVKALLQEGFQVTGVTRPTTSADRLPAGLQHHATSDYSVASLKDIFQGQDAVVSTISSIVPGGDLMGHQLAAVEAAAAAGVQVFVPSEYGIDTSDPHAVELIPFLSDKHAVLEALQKQQDKMAWIAIVSGGMFDWSFAIPGGFGGWNVSERKVTLYDGGDVPYEATNLDQVGRAIAKSLVHIDITRNQTVRINSFTVTQNKVLAALEKATGDKFAVSHSTVDALWQGGADKVKAGQILGAIDMVAGATYGKGGLAQFSTKQGLWNDKIGLAQEDLNSFIASGGVKLD